MFAGPFIGVRAFLVAALLVPAAIARTAVSAGRRKVLLNQAHRGANGEPDVYVNPIVNSYKNPHASNLGGYVIEPTWGKGWEMTVPGLEGKKWDPNVWAWVDEGPAPAPAPPPPPPAPPGEPVGNPPPKQSDQMDCGKLKEMSEKDYADSPAMDCHPMGVRGGGTLPGHTQPDCMCYAWTSNCPYEGLTLAGCYDATSAGNYEATKKGLTDKLGLAGVDIMYMICAQGGATPEWKFLQVGERTERWKGRAPNATVPGAMALLQYGRQVVPCVFNPGSPGCPTQPPVMFPYTPTATLSVEISALPDVVGKAQKENEDGAFCFKTPSELQPDVCTEWKSGEPCCAVAPVTEPPSVPEPAM